MSATSNFNHVISQKDFVYENDVEVRFKFKIDNEKCEFSVFYNKNENLNEATFRDRAFSNVQSQIKGLDEAIEFCIKKSQLLKLFLKENKPSLEEQEW